MNKLIRGLNLRQAVAINTIDMVGIGPFTTISLIIGAMNGPQCIMAWVLGAILAFADGAVWAELGARWPEAGGSYAFLENLYGKQKWGKLMSFLFVWQTIIQAPLVVASGAIGFSLYFAYLLPVTPLQQKMISGALVILITLLLYRKITDIGRIAVFMGVVVIGTMLWLIVGGLTHFNSSLAFNYPANAFALNKEFFSGLGQAGTKAIYCYLGYYNICHLGAEIQKPERNIPKSIFRSIVIIAILYLLMQISVLGVIPWQQAKDSSFIVSLFFEKVYGHTAALIATGLILLIAVSSLFSVLLGYSRIPYAAAENGNFFPVFAKLHPTRNFPVVSLLTLAGIAFVFSLLFKMQQVITAIIVVRILIQFFGQGAALLAYHRQHPNARFPYRMWLYPVPAIIAMAVWLFIFFSAEAVYIAGSLGIIVTGCLLFLAKSYWEGKWPFVKD